MVSPALERAQAVTFREWAETYLSLEEVRKLTTYEDRKLKVSHLVEFFGDRPLASITPADVAVYRAQRVRYPRTKCEKCAKPLGKAVCPVCGWERTDSPLPASMQTINHDHTALTHMLNVVRSPRFKLIQDNPASHVEKPDPKNERDRIASAERWARLQATAAPHLLRFLTVAYTVGPRSLSKIRRIYCGCAGLSQIFRSFSLNRPHYSPQTIETSDSNQHTLATIANLGQAPRKGELLKLEWPDVDIRRKEFTLRKTKNGEMQLVPMPPDVLAVFWSCGKTVA